MLELTEAEALLQTGTLYHRRLGLQPDSGDLIFVGQKRGAYSVYSGNAPIYHFDLEGRWQRAFLDGVHYRKSLDNAVAAIDRVRHGPNMVLQRRKLTFAEVGDLDDLIRLAAMGLAAGIGAGDLTVVAPDAADRGMSGEELGGMLDQVGSWDATAWFNHRERYRNSYAPLGFLPPDAHQAVVVQATVGQGADFATRTPEEFRDHLEAVRNVLGRRVLQANGLFFEGADALRLPAENLVAMFDHLAEVFPLRTPGAGKPGPDQLDLGGIDALIADAQGEWPGREVWESLVKRGLRRVNIILRDGEVQAIRALSADLKAAGASLGLIVPIGEDPLAGGWDLPTLGRGDLLYAIDRGDIDQGREPLEAGWFSGQVGQLRDHLAEARGRGLKIVPYNREKQWN